MTDMPKPVHKPYLEYLPVALFGSVMGLSGLSVAWHLAQARYGAPGWITELIGGLAVAAFVAVFLGYAVKLITAPESVEAEFKHPIAGNLFGTFLISLLLLPIIIVPYSPLLAQMIWSIGTLGMLLFAWIIVSRWMSERQQIAHATPAWIVPVVGLLDVPLAVPALGLPPELHGLMIFCLALGLFFALPLFTLIFSRLVFEPPIPEASQPTLMILVAPFAVGASSYVTTTGQFDLFAQSLYMITLFILAVLIGRLRYLGMCCPFRVSWWAVSFPLAASAIVALRFAAFDHSVFADIIAWLLLGFATLAIAWLLIRTLYGIAKGELRTLSS